MHYEQKEGAVIPKRVHTIVISVQHDDYISLEEQKKVLKEKVGVTETPREDSVRTFRQIGEFSVGPLATGDQRCCSC